MTEGKGGCDVQAGNDRYKMDFKLSGVEEKKCICGIRARGSYWKVRESVSRRAESETGHSSLLCICRSLARNTRVADSGMTEAELGRDIGGEGGGKNGC